MCPAYNINLVKNTPFEGILMGQLPCSYKSRLCIEVCICNFGVNRMVLTARVITCRQKCEVTEHVHVVLIIVIIYEAMGCSRPIGSLGNNMLTSNLICYQFN